MNADLVEKQTLLIALAAIVVIAVVPLLYLSYRRAVKARINKESPRIKALEGLNSSMAGKSVQDLVVRHLISTSSELRQFDPVSCFAKLVIANKQRFAKWLSEAEEAELAEDAYRKKVEQIPPSTYSRNLWREIEDELFSEKSHAVFKTNPSVIFKWSTSDSFDTSENCGARVFSLADVGTYLALENERQLYGVQFGNSALGMQADLTNSLRYDVLKRDNFHCVLCGASAKDNDVRLIVAPRVPLATGDSSRIDSFQTVCEKCYSDLGFSDSSKVRYVQGGEEFRRESMKRERALMTDSLRQSVLKRDNYRCVCCGLGESDGAKLEIDHIVPISKGGKTELNNLQTLCFRCNRGKRDKL